MSITNTELVEESSSASTENLMNSVHSSPIRDGAGMVVQLRFVDASRSGNLLNIIQAEDLQHIMAPPVHDDSSQDRSSDENMSKGDKATAATMGEVTDIEDSNDEVKMAQLESIVNALHQKDQQQVSAQKRRLTAAKRIALADNSDSSDSD